VAKWQKLKENRTVERVGKRLNEWADPKGACRLEMLASYALTPFFALLYIDGNMFKILPVLNHFLVIKED
jgi:hypothetical protein